MKKILYSFMLGAIVLTSCRNYVEIDAVGKRPLKYTDDYQYLLNNGGVMDHAFYYSELASDEVGISDEKFQTTMSQKDAAVYTWADRIYADTEEDPDWAALYKEIYVCNEITNSVMSSTGGTDAQKADIYAQAQVHRAFAYFDLVNVFAKQYDVATAASDNGVPLLLTPDLYASLKRASVQEVYDQINKDLTEAIQVLPYQQSSKFIASKTAAYGVLARVCLQMGKYEEATNYADSVLDRQSTLINLSDYADAPTTFPQKQYNQEIVFFKVISMGSPILPLSDRLLNLFDKKDLRYQMFVASGHSFPWSSFEGFGYWGSRLANDGVYAGPCVPEMMLIKAEGLARKGMSQQAVDILNALRIKRFKTADYVELSATNNEDALRLVLEERQRELFGRGFRWFDQKRLNKEEAFAQTVTRVFKGVTYTLAPNDNKYVFPIANKYIILNPVIEQNPR